jgi:hypothetical protein
MLMVTTLWASTQAQRQLGGRTPTWASCSSFSTSRWFSEVFGLVALACGGVAGVQVVQALDVAQRKPRPSG